MTLAQASVIHSNSTILGYQNEQFVSFVKDVWSQLEVDELLNPVERLCTKLKVLKGKVSS